MPPFHARQGLSPNALGDLVRRRRQDVGLSLREAARQIGISPSYLSALELGRNPSTGRAPLPSPPVLAAISRVLEIELAELLDASGAPRSRSAHVLLYQTGVGRQSPLEAARAVFADLVDAWIEITDPERPGEVGPRPADVVARKRGPLSLGGGGPGLFEPGRVLAALDEVLAEVAPSSPSLRVGFIFGANSTMLRTVENPRTQLESEATWEHDLAAALGASRGMEPAANVCVYREVDVQELGTRLDPLATVLGLIESHPHVVVQGGRGRLTTGPAAIELILSAARPAGVSSGTWATLARAAAAGLAREAQLTSPTGARHV